MIKKQNNTSDFTVVISPLFPQFKMPLILKQNITAMAEVISNSDSSIFRALIKNLLKDQEIWENSNAEILLNEWPIIQAAFHFINSLRNSFVFKNMRYILGQICNESRADKKKRQLLLENNQID